jgi:hypothetical protein
MQIDIKGKINEKKLSYSNTLLPLFEAIVNSIHAIEEGSATEIGIIEIDIVRSIQSKMQFDKDAQSEITDFIITDNGIGFNEDNYNSFNFAHSTYKFAKGGKGIGRFTWLRAFQKAEIESMFNDGNRWQLRKFNFEPTKNGIEKHTCDPVEENGGRRTVVRLKNLKKDYRKWCNTSEEGIALKIIEHCFVYFLNPKCPRIIINGDEKRLVANDLFTLFTKGQVKDEQVTIRENSFKLSIVRLYSSKVDNKIHYCANTREVMVDKLSVDIPELDTFLYDKEDKAFSIAVYVEGGFLDDHVNDERTNIAFARKGTEFPDEISQEELRQCIASKLLSDFSEEIGELAVKRVAKVKEFVTNHPQYRQLLKYRSEEIKRVPSTLSEEKMELELFKIQQSLDLEVKKEAGEVLRFISSDEDKVAFRQQHQKVFNKIIEVGNSKLSEYVIHRKLVLDLFEKLLIDRVPEKAVHNLIFPLQKLSDDIGFEDHNLWIVDDKLAYHKYLASDKRFKAIEPLDSDSTDRPDVLIFNRPFAFANDNKPYQSIVLMEFKRPMRDDYTDEENPILQVNRYAREIIEGEAKDKHGREFDFRENTPIYAYIICDLTKKLRAYAKDAGYKPLPSGDGYFDFNSNYNMYVEILSFDKVLNDSRERNRVLFDKLNLT